VVKYKWVCTRGNRCLYFAGLVGQDKSVFLSGRIIETVNDYSDFSFISSSILLMSSMSSNNSSLGVSL